MSLSYYTNGLPSEGHKKAKAREEKNKGEPKFGHVYALTGTPDDKAISNGHSWAESEVSKKKVMAKKMSSGHEHFYRHVSVGDKDKKCIHCGKGETKKGYIKRHSADLLKYETN